MLYNLSIISWANNWSTHGMQYEHLYVCIILTCTLRYLLHLLPQN